MIRSVEIHTIPHTVQRYPTLGDWVVDDDGLLSIYCSDLGDWRMAFVCGMHEAIEAALCTKDGVREVDVSRFDTLYETKRAGGEAAVQAATQLLQEFGCTCDPTPDSEPGEDRHAPYRRQHAFADGVERLLAFALGLPWAEYEKAAEQAFS